MNVKLQEKFCAQRNSLFPSLYLSTTILWTCRSTGFSWNEFQKQALKSNLRAKGPWSKGPFDQISRWHSLPWCTRSPNSSICEIWTEPHWENLSNRISLTPTRISLHLPTPHLCSDPANLAYSSIRPILSNRWLAVQIPAFTTKPTPLASEWNQAIIQLVCY